MKARKGKIAILGCGWLGLPLGMNLIRQGFKVNGSTTSIQKLEEIGEKGIAPFLVKVSPEGVSGQLEGFLTDVEVLIISFPPGLRSHPDLDFSGAIRALGELISEAGIKKIIFISSIAVYKNTSSFKICTEDVPPNATSRSGKELITAENLLMGNKDFSCTILRMGGLFGPGRHPVKYLAGRKNLADPLGPVNLIHLDDCIGILNNLLDRDQYGELYNLVYPLNPPRESYYKHKAHVLGLPPPEFDHSTSSKGKVISSSKIMRVLDYKFQESI